MIIRMLVMQCVSEPVCNETLCAVLSLSLAMFDETDFDGRRINVQLNKMHPKPQRY